MAGNTPISPYNLERVDRCPIDVYVASNMPYPYKLGKPRNAPETLDEWEERESCITWIMDSGIGDDVSNREVLDLAAKFDADWVVAKDYLHDQDRTTESVAEFLDLYADHDCRAMPLIPLQPPHDEHYRDLPGHAAYVLGGMAGEEVSTAEAVEYLRAFRRVAGYGPYVHALGIGGSMTFVRAVANDPRLVDSVDCSTPEQAAKNGAILDAHLKHQPIEILVGEGSSRGRYDLAKTNAYQINDALTATLRDSGQATLGEFPQVATDGSGGDRR